MRNKDVLSLYYTSQSSRVLHTCFHAVRCKVLQLAAFRVGPGEHKNSNRSTCQDSVRKAICLPRVRRDDVDVCCVIARFRVPVMPLPSSTTCLRE